MYFKEPYIFKTPVKANPFSQQEGTHAVFAVRVPFIPSFLTTDFTRSLIGGGRSRLELVTERQVRFLNDMLNARDIGKDRDNILTTQKIENDSVNPSRTTIELRYITRPDTERQKSKIDIVFLGKVFHKVESEAERRCLQLWHKFVAHFPFEDPFNYPLEPIEKTNDERLLCPIAFEKLNTTDNPILEIRKYEDFDPFKGKGTRVGYFPHRFMPTFDASAMGRFLETLTQQRQVCVASICLRPTVLFDDELRYLMLKLSKDNDYLLELNKLANQSNTPPNAKASTDQSSNLWKKIHFEERLKDIRDTFWPIINRRFHLFEIKIQVLGEVSPPTDVLESLGSELLGNTYKQEPRIWSCEYPHTSEELAIARYNFKFLEHHHWKGQQQMTDKEADRLRYLLTPTEAAGAFRLPIPPESGYLPGVVVRDEPFVLPQNVEANPIKSISLGNIIHHGQIVEEEFWVPIKDLTKHGLIAGVTGSGKTNTCLHLLSQLWSKHQIPFLVMYPIDKPDYRLLMADHHVKEKLLIYTVGDETTSPFRFNPFYVADKILLKTHISLLMRCFSAAFSMWDPLPAVFRATIRCTYEKADWKISEDTGETGRQRNAYTPTMSQFYDTLVEVAEKMTANFDPEARDRVRKSAEIRLHDLLLNAGMIINAERPAPLDEILHYPTIMELGRVGSTQDAALIMGFLLVLIGEELQNSYKKMPPDERRKPIHHITLIEEAHRLMSAGQGSSEDLANPQAKGGEDFANILAEVRGFGEGILIAEQIPTQLVNGAIGNTNLKIMHKLEDQESFQLFCDVLNLNERQKEYVRSLGQGEVIVRGHDSRPVFVKVGNYLDQFQTPEDHTIIDDSDDGVKQFMQQQLVQIPASMPWNPQQVVSKSSIRVSLGKDSQEFLDSIRDLIEAEQWEPLKQKVYIWFKHTQLDNFYVTLWKEIVTVLGYTGEEAEKLLPLFE